MAAIMVTLAVFLLTAGFLIGMFSADVQEEEAFDSPRTIIAGTSYDLFEPVGGRDITWANVTDSYHPHPSSYTMNFWRAGGVDPFEVTVVRNNSDIQESGEDDEWFKYDNYIGFEHDWGWWSYGRIALPLSTITSIHNQSDNIGLNVVVYNFTFHNPYVMIIETASASTFVDDIFVDNEYTIYFGEVAFFEEEITGTNFWDTFWNILDAIATLFTFNALPAVPVISYLVSGAIWMALVYVVYTLIVRGLHGGG